MYKIALVDDEAVVREGMKDLIPWNEIGLELVGTAEDGETGLVLIQEQLPDIILLDINMPKLNGLDLANIICKNYGEIKIILISGYDEFDYARQALRMGVEDYILKPVTRLEMITLLKRVVGKLDKEKEQTKKETDVLNKIEQSIPLIQQKLLEELVFGEVEPSLISKRCIKANIPYNKKNYGVFLLGIDEADESLTHFAVQNIVGEILIHENWGIIFEIDHVNAVLYFTDQEKDVEQEYERALHYIHHKVGELLGITVTVGAGGLVSEVNQIGKSYDEAYYGLVSSFFEGTGNIINHIKPSAREKVDFTQRVEWENEIIRSMDQPADFERVMGQICMEIRTIKMLKEDIEEVWNNILCSMLKKFIEIDSSITEIFPHGINTKEEIQKCRTLIDMQTWMGELYHKCYNYINHQSNPNKIHMKNILAYIDENYTLNNLSMKMVCDGVHISSSHLSNIFKKEMGMTFVQYVTDYRINKAQQLLKYTALKTYEIAEAVGYSDSQYFSTAFKRQVRMSPLEYRRVHGERERR